MDLQYKIQHALGEQLDTNSDGYCEQGQTYISLTAANMTVNLIKSFKDINYVVCIRPFNSSTTGYAETIILSAKSVNSFTAHGANSGATAAKTAHWMAFGYV